MLPISPKFGSLFGNGEINCDRIVVGMISISYPKFKVLSSFHPPWVRGYMLEMSTSMTWAQIRLDSINVLQYIYKL